MANKLSISRRNILAASAILPFGLTACSSEKSIIKLSGATMGTYYNVIAVDHEGKISDTDLRPGIENALEIVNAHLSNWDANSEVSKFNAAHSTDEMSVSKPLAEILTAANDVNVGTEGQFDITLGPIIEAWGFGANGSQNSKPDAAVVDANFQHVGQAKNLEISNTGVKKNDPETKVYLSGIGKGYGVDQVAQALRSAGLNDFMVEIGGDIYTSGKNAEGMAWQIGIERPLEGSKLPHKIVQVSNMGMATSGDYRNYFVDEGERFSHIFDAKTGRPVTHDAVSVTVLAENAMLADAWATGLLALGTERGLEISNQRDIAVLFIEKSAKSGEYEFITHTSDKFKKLQA